MSQSFAVIMLFAWIPVVLFLFLALPPQRAVAAAYVAGWLTLPVIGISFPGLPDYTKMTATSYAVLLGCTLFDLNRLMAFRPGWLDLPMLGWCLCPLASSISNNLGVYNGASLLLSNTVTYGLPYFIGRLYFSDLSDLRELATAIFVGGLVYVPLCLFELRMSAQLNHLVYGTQIRTGMKYGLYNPIVFMSSSLELGMWISASALAGCWLWATGGLPRLKGIATGPLAAALTVTAVLCHQTGAIVLLATGLVILGSVRSGRCRPTALVLILLTMPPLYMTLRATHLWSGQILVEISQALLNEERAGSLGFRLENEDVFTDHVLNHRPLLGWSGQGRNLPYFEKYHKTAIPDGFWVIALGLNGLVGLVSITLVFLLPSLQLWWRVPVASWKTPPVAGAASVAILLGLYMMDNLFNAMFNPIYLLAAGSLMDLRIGDGTSHQADAANAVTAASAAYRVAVHECLLSGSGSQGQQVAALDAAGRELERAMWEAEESAADAAEAEALLLSLIRVDVELADALRAVGLEEEAGSHYLRAVERGEQFLAGITGQGAGSATLGEVDARPESCWDPAGRRRSPRAGVGPSVSGNGSNRSFRAIRRSGRIGPMLATTSPGSWPSTPPHPPITRSGL